MSIRYWNRRQQEWGEEKVFGDAFVRAAYETPTGRFLTDKLLVRKTFSQIYGFLQNTRWSASKIPEFCHKFQIPLEQFEPGPFATFNDFFIRRFRAGQRNFPQESTLMGAPAEARYFGFSELLETTTLPVKGLKLLPKDILSLPHVAELFQGGPCLLARLCPVDYHRFHFPDSGEIQSAWRESGKLHSVNPVALAARPQLFWENERQISILETEHFGKLAYVEVGALCVGKIVQSNDNDARSNFRRGEEKGYFLFGASTVIIFGERGRWHPAKDVLENTAKGFETLVELGSAIAEAIH